VERRPAVGDCVVGKEGVRRGGMKLLNDVGFDMSWFGAEDCGVFCWGIDRPRAFGMNLLALLMSALSLLLLPGLEKVFGIQEARDADGGGDASLFLEKEFVSLSNEGLFDRPKVFLSVCVPGSCPSASPPLAPAYLGGTHGAVGFDGAGNGGGGGASFMRLFTLFDPGGEPLETDVSIHFFLTWKQKKNAEPNQLNSCVMFKDCREKMDSTLPM
jgi:hypothetical protein